MKKTLFTFFSLLGFACLGQGFSSVSTNWALPDGGSIAGGNSYGFNYLNNTAYIGDNVGSQTWFIQDMNGDKSADLVVSAQLQDGYITCFSPGLNPYWKVYLSTGNGFSTSAINWTIPNGGQIAGAIIRGFNNLTGTAQNPDNAGSQSWSLMDMDGDKKPDLVVTAELQSSKITCFSPGSSPYWKVYINSGTGFSSTALNWTLPNGGKINNGATLGFNSAEGYAYAFNNAGSQSWSLLDMDGDAKPDLVVTAQLQNSITTCFSPGAGQYWKVFYNSGSGFAIASSTWNLPNGGSLIGGNTLGYSNLAGSASSSDNTGSQTWAVLDMDGDQKPELVVTAQLQSGNVTCFSPGSNQYWKVYANNSNGFATTATNWNLPNGGRINGGITYGYDRIYQAGLSSDNTASQSWFLTNLDGYSSPELVVTAQMQSGQLTCFSPGTNQYWKVYKNTNTGFSSSAINCSLPVGGRLSGGVTYGYDYVSGFAASADNGGSQSWGLADMNGDGITDLVVPGQLQSGLITSFSPSSNQYWKVYSSDFVTGIKENKKDIPTFNVFPNPSNGASFIKSSVSETITITDETGREIKRIELTDSNNYTGFITGLPDGIYFLEGKTTRSKIIVLH